ncbi:MAG: site-2 protease family protein [Clostridia bacterium]|nr:site-2 protease family protein [Clostridia bacterium]
MILFNLQSIMNDPLRFLRELACLLPVMLLSLTLHEWGHAFAAHKCGDDTAKNMGRMTLNPFAHIDPIGFFMILIAGFGWAKPVPVNSRNFRNYKKGEAIVSLAGVFMNLMLVLAFSALYVFFQYLFYTKSYAWLDSDVLWTVLLYGIILNVTLMLFNLLPIFPLDGYHIFELLFAKMLPMKAFLFLRRYGMLILIGIMLLMRVLEFFPAYELSMWLLGKLDTIVNALL